MTDAVIRPLLLCILHRACVGHEAASSSWEELLDFPALPKPETLLLAGCGAADLGSAIVRTASLARSHVWPRSFRVCLVLRDIVVDGAQDDMTSVSDASAASIYPKRYFDASRTWFEWNKVTAKDVFALREERGFEGDNAPNTRAMSHILTKRVGQNVYFKLNHPIQYVYLCGVVVQVELAPGAGATKFALITLDDGSGKVIEVKIPRRQTQLDDDAVFPSNTLINNVNVWVDIAVASVHVDGKALNVGSVIRVKGTITVFRERQIELKRIFRVKDTNEEAAFWTSLAKWRREVLSKPWVLTHEQKTKIDVEIAEATKQTQKRAVVKKGDHAARLARKAKVDEKKEKRRLLEAATFDAGALPGSHILRAPWQ